MAVPTTTLGINVGQHTQDIVATTGTGTPAQQVQIIIATDSVTEQQMLIDALEYLTDYVIGKGWPVA